jgi:ferrous iron transport protein B
VSEILVPKVLNVVLMGAPNSGKTTLYNWLTGSKHKTVNYPGATIEFSKGELKSELVQKFENKNFDRYVIYDTPGIYSLSPKSADEEVTYHILTEQSLFHIDLALVVVDATQMNRQLLICAQLAEMKIPFQIIFTMNDVTALEGYRISSEEIKKEFSQKHILYFDGIFGKGLLEISSYLNQFQCVDYSAVKIKWDLSQIQHITNHLQSVYRKSVQAKAQPMSSGPLARTLKIDQYLLHPIYGSVIFLFLMTLLFSSIYWIAQPFMDLIESGFSEFSSLIQNQMPGLLGQFLSDGVVTAIGGVVIFVPQIFILFLFIGFLENTGYLARIAALVDKPLSMVGLGGRSFVPMLSGFACAVPAIMATRNIKSKKEKLIAQFIVPFMTCSARLPVYALILGFLFSDQNPIYAGTAMAGLYFMSIVVGAIASGIVSKIIGGSEKSQLSLDLPLYRSPRLPILFIQALQKSKSFLFRAGPIIFILALVLWVASSFPQNLNHETRSASEITEQSYAAQFGKNIQPVFEPLGVDWRVGFGILSAFAAREVFVSAMAIVFHVEGDEAEQSTGLLVKMKNAQFESGPNQGQRIFTVASCVGILIFFMIALQCLSTFAILKKEGGMALAMAQLVFSNVAAYALAVSAVTILKNMGY